MSETSPTVSVQAYLRSGAVQDRISALMDDRASDFTTSLMSTVNANPVLQQCKPESILKAAITAASMRLTIAPGMGFAYIIPYKNHGVYEAQFQMGWKGYVQLALRTKQYLTINATDVREGEYLGEDQLTGKMTFNWNLNKEEREKLPVVGYAAHIELVGGFTKTAYMTIGDLERHAKHYSKQYASGGGQWADKRGSGFGFMAQKTVLKLLISKYGPMSTDIEKAIRADQASIADGDQYNYIDNDHDKAPNTDIDQTPTQPTEAEADQTPVTAKPAKKTAKKKHTSVKKKPAAKTPTDEGASITEEVTAKQPEPVDDDFRTQTTAQFEALGLNARGKMAFLNMTVTKPTLAMVKADDD